MVISVMTIDDYDKVYALWLACGNEGVCVDDDVDSHKGIAAYLKRNAGMSLVARRDGRLVGCVLCGTDGRRGYLNHLAVDKAYRGQGIGKKLVERSLAGLEKAGIHKCHIFVLNTNTAGRAFWSHLGWVLRDNFAIMSHLPQTNSCCGGSR
jgi:ribosomal protein S18 acetylase RimI-like enzyme